MKKLSLTLILISFVASGLFAMNGDTSLQTFNKQLASVYADYRMALFQTNKNNQAKSLKIVTRFHKNWGVLVSKYTDHAPEVYHADPSWKATLKKVSGLAAQGLRETKMGKLHDAHESLELIRDELAELRRRNNIVAFSDHVNRYHEQMEAVVTTKYASGSLAVEQLNVLREKLALLDYLAVSMKKNAPVPYNNNPEFKKLLGNNFVVLASLRSALDRKDAAAIKKAIKQLKPAYAKLFIKFG